MLPPRVSQIRIDYGAATPVSSEGVRFRYHDDAPALEGIDLTVPARLQELIDR